MRVDELSASLRTALKNLPQQIRPDDRDIGVMAQLMANMPCLSRWDVAGQTLDFGQMQPKSIGE